jgi:hypothetical protein
MPNILFIVDDAPLKLADQFLAASPSALAAAIIACSFLFAELSAALKS